MASFYKKVQTKLQVAQGIAAVLVALSMLVGSAHGQVSFGTILGTLSDPSGAVVPQAKVTITNVDTNLIRTLETDSAGAYSAPSLPPGHYIVTVEKAGFKTQKGNALTLAADQTAHLDFGMVLGAADQVIDVDTSSSQLQTDNPGVGTTIDSKKVVDLPLNGRN